MTFLYRLLTPRTERDHIWGVAVHVAILAFLVGAAGYVFEWTQGQYLAMSIVLGSMVMFHRVGPWLGYRRDKNNG